MKKTSYIVALLTGVLLAIGFFAYWDRDRQVEQTQNIVTSPGVPSEKPADKIAAVSAEISQGAESLSAPVPRGNALLAQKAAQDQKPASEAAFARFAKWSEDYVQADATARAAMEAEGVDLAKERRVAMAEMIQADPKRALELAASNDLRSQLPASVTDHLEERISGRGTLESQVATLQKSDDEPAVGTFRQVAFFGQQSFQAFAYGGRWGGITRENVFMNGVAVGDLFALHENPVRVLEPMEAAGVIARINRMKEREEVCAVSDLPITVNQQETIVEAGDENMLLCGTSHVDDLNQQLLDGEVMLATSATGSKQILYIRIEFTGKPCPVAGSSGVTTMTGGHNDSSTFYWQNSFHQTDWVPIGTSGSSSRITAVYDLGDVNNRGGDTIYNAATTRAANNGYVLSDYQIIVVCSPNLNHIFNGASYASIGGKKIFLNGDFGRGWLFHEAGHVYGAGHAAARKSDGTITNPFNGSFQEYGDVFDALGQIKQGFQYHFNSWIKRRIGWISGTDVTSIPDNTLNGVTNVIYAIDNVNSRGGGRKLALKIAHNSSRDFWVDYRTRFTDNDWLLNGAGIRSQFSPPTSGSADVELLDMVPGTATLQDSALVIGKTYSHSSANIHITPVGKGTTTINGASVGFLRIVVNRDVGANSAPTINSITGPSSGAVGETLSFTANATDPEGRPMAYYWDFHNGSSYNTDFQSANNKTITYSWGSTGTKKVRCRVTDMRGGVSAAKEFTVTIGTTPSAPVITSQPQSQTVAVGANATFTVSADGNSKSYQWRFNGGNISGATASSYTRSNVQTSHAGNYSVVVSNPGGSVTSANAALTVQQAIAITGQPQNATNNVGANVTFTVTATGTSPTFQWRFNGGNISGATASSYTRSNIQPSHEGNYSVVVANAVSSVTSANAFLKVIEPIVITSQPQSQTNNVGANVTFSVMATGTSLKYQWRFEGVNISGATTSTLAKNNIQLTDQGNYSVRITNSSYTNISANAFLTVRDAISISAQPKNSTNNIGDNAQFTVTASGSTNLAYQWRFNGGNISAATDSALNVAVANTNVAGTYSVVVSSPTATNVTSANALLVIPYGNRTKITQWDHNNSPYTGASTTTPSLGSGSVMVVSNVWSDPSAPRGGVSSDPTGGINYARSLAGPSGTTANKTSGIRYNASTVGYTNIAVTWEQRVGDRASGYWRGQYTTNGTTWIDRAVVDKRTLYVQQGGEAYAYHSDNLSGVAGVHNNANFAYRILAEYQSTATGSGSAAYVSADPNSTYNGTGNPAARWDMVTVMGTPIVEPIVITGQPQGATVAVGANHTLNVTASGTLPKYQWRFNGANMSGKTLSSLAMTNLQLTNSGNYTVVITNSANSVTSAIAALTVQAPISITGQPQSQTNYVSSNVTFTVTATGTSPQYQWRFNAVNIPNATQSAYTRSNVQSTNAGNYSVVVSNLISSSTSANAALTVLPVPVERYWSGNGSTLGGAGTWNTSDSRWGFTAGGPFAHAWNNAYENSPIFSGTAGAITIGAPVTASQITFAIAGYSLSGSSAITFAGEDAGIFSPGANNTSTTNTMSLTSPLAGAVLVKTGGGRLFIANSANTVEKWVVKEGAISGASASGIFGSGNPAELVADFITLDGGGLGIQNSVSLGANRGIYLGPSGGKIGVTASSTTLTIDGPITGMGGITFPGFTSWPGQIHGAAGTFVFSNPANDYQGETAISIGTLLLGNEEVLPDTTTVTITGSAKLDLNSFSDSVGNVVVNGSNAQIINGRLLATSFDLRRGVIDADLSGAGNMTKTTANNVTLLGWNTYTGHTTLSEGTVTISGSGTFGDGSGSLNLAGANIILTETRTEETTLLNPVVMSANTTIENGAADTNSIFFVHNGPWTTSGGTLTIRNASSTGAGSFDLVLANAFNFTRPIVIGLSGEKPCQLTSYSPAGVNQTFSGAISGTGSFLRSVAEGASGGQTTFTADNTYSGGTLVDAGALVVNNPGAGSGTGSGSVTVGTSGTLLGNGSISGSVAVNSGGSISAGSGVGVLTLGGGLNLSSGGTNVWELSALKDDSTGVAGTDFDQLVLTGGQLQLGGSSKLQLKFVGISAPNNTDQFWRFNRSWKIVRLNGGGNTANATFASIANASYSSGTFSTQVDGSGNIILKFTTSFAGKLWWSGGGTSLGGTGTWDTTNARWGSTNAAPFNIVWNNGSGSSAYFEGTGGSVTIGANATVNRITVSSSGYNFAGTSTVTFSGTGSGIDTLGSVNFTNSYPMAGAIMTKSGSGRLHLNNTGNTVTNWVVNEGVMSIQAQSHLGPNPASMRPDFVTLDGGGLGWEGTSAVLQGNRGLTLGAGGGKLAIRGGATLAISAPITGPGGLTFPSFSGFHSSGIYGANVPFTLSNTSNDYQGNTTVSTGTLTLGASGVLPDTTTLTLSGGKLNLAGFNETVASVVVNSSSSQITGAGTLSASTFDLRNSGVISSILAGSGSLIKTTANNVTLNAANTYSGDTIISEGTVTINDVGRFGNGAGVLYLAGGGIILSSNRAESATLMNPVVMTGDATIANGNTGTGAVLFRHGGTWEAEGGILTIRNATSASGGSFDVVLTNGFIFDNPIVIGLAGDKPSQLTSFNPTVGPDSDISDQVFNGQISGVGSFRKSVSSGAGGRTVFAADNTYSGGTVVNAGILFVDNPGPGSGTGTNIVTVSGTGSLVGSGSIGGNVVVNSGGSISAGVVAGQLTLQNGLNLSNGGTNIWELSAAMDDEGGTAGVDFDQLVLTGGNLQLGGTSKLVLAFPGDVGAPNIAEPFWRFNHSWTIVQLAGASNTGSTKFTTILNATNSAGYFANSVDASGNIILTFTSYSTNDLFWSSDSSSLGDAGTWNTSGLNWGNASHGPFNQAWNNASGKGAIFESTGGEIAIGTAITVKKITVGVDGYSFTGANAITFSGTGAGVDYPVTTLGDSYKLSFTGPLAGSVVTKTGAGRMHLSNTGNTVSKWVLNGGIISVAGVNRFGATPGSLVPDLITLDGGGIGFDGTSPTLGTTRGVTLGTNSGNIFGVRDSTVTLTIDGPITGPGDISFPGFSAFPTRIHGGAGTFIFSNTNNNYGGGTTVSVGTLQLGAAGVLPNTTVVTVTGSAKLDLNGFNETVEGVVLNGSNARIIGSGILTASSYEARRSGDVTAILAGSASLIKTTGNTATLSGANTYSGGTSIEDGTLLVNNASGSGTGSASVTVLDGGTLGGRGFVSGNVAVTDGGSISAGSNGTGKLTLQNGLNMSEGGTSIWELGALKDNSNGTAGTDFDQLVLTGGQLVLGGNSKLSIVFSGTASAPDSAVSFWQSNHTWTIVHLNGGQNTTNLTFASISDATYDAGTFSTSISGGSILLTYTANPSRPLVPVSPPPVIEFSNPEAPNVVIHWNAVPGKEYEVHYTTDLATGLWYHLTNVVAEGASVSVTDLPSDGEPQRFYRLFAK